MAARQNTTVCTFDPTRPWITAFDIHGWIHETLRLPEQKVSMMQIDGPKRQIFIKLTEDYVHTIIRGQRGK
jgi:hypothetical protein